MDNLNNGDSNFDYLKNFSGHLESRTQAIVQSLLEGQQPQLGLGASFLGHLGAQRYDTPEDFQRAFGQAQNRLKSYDDIINRLGQRNYGPVAAANPPGQPGFTPPGNTAPANDLSTRLYGISGITVLTMQQEPICWRSYADPDNVVHQLKPRLYAVTSDGSYEDHWFFEYDAGKEAPAQALQKCRQYEDYYNSNTEQRDSGMFPVIVWVVPDAAHKGSLQNSVVQSQELQHKELFLFVTPDELEPLIRKGAGEGGLQ